MKGNVVVLLGAVPQLSEPFSVMEITVSFLEKIKNVTKSHIRKELWIVRPRPVGRNAAYKRKRLIDWESQWKHPKMSIAKSYQGQRGTGLGRG